MSKQTGRAWVFSDDVDTDLIYHNKYLAETDPKQMPQYAFEYYPGMENFGKEVKPGDFVVAGKNFGCGSSREHAPLSIKYLGISCIIASTFARIFFRNALNIGLPILECEEAAQNIKPGDTVSVDFNTGVITNETSGQTFQAEPFPPFMQNLIACGGLVNYSKGKIGK